MKSATAGSGVPPGPPKLAPKPGSVKVMRALYKYVAQYPDELSFQEGDILYVIDQVSDPNWWKARCGNQTGLIPSNYVGDQVEEVQTPLHEAARRGNLNFMQECLSQGVSGTGLDHAGNTPLYWACHAGHVDCVKELLMLPNPAVNAQNKIGDTPLHSAASKGHLTVVELLLENGADSSIRNKDGDTAENLSMNSAITNCIQQKRANFMQQRPSSYSLEDYEDDSD
ncbi:Tonsoku-like protein [Gryllus bimaculatus]|nr:Tonsoku-like protein [Gryllus bimaculatus]